jgi:predicted PurR-regulated permease PerM
MPPLWILAALAFAAAAYYAGAVLIPLTVALFLSVLLEPVVAWCVERGLRRGRAAGLVVAGFLLVCAAAVWSSARPFSGIVSDMPSYSAKIRAGAAALGRRAPRFEEGRRLLLRALSPAASMIDESATPDAVSSWSQFFWRGLGSFFEAAGIATFVPFLMIVMLSEKELLAEALQRLLGSSYDVGLAGRETGRMVRAYFGGNLAAGAVMAFLHWMVFVALGLRNAAGLGLVTGLLALIPLVGLPAALLLPMAQGLVQFDSAATFIALALSMSGIHLLNANYVVPRAIGGSVRINATAATAGLLFWGWLWGVTGFVLAVPLTALIKIALESGKDTEVYAGLLASRPRPARPPFARRWLQRRHAARDYAPRPL